MEIFRGTSAQMLEIWDGRFEDFVDSHVSAVDSGVQECWLMRDEENGKLMGELHVLWDKPDDPDYADGKEKAYLMAFRIHEEYQGKGYGTMLMKRVLERIRERGFTKATIGADDYDPKLQPCTKSGDLPGSSNGIPLIITMTAGWSPVPSLCWKTAVWQLPLLQNSCQLPHLFPGVQVLLGRDFVRVQGTGYPGQIRPAEL